MTPSGKAPSAGEVFRNPDMAAVLRELGAGGKEAFYGGRVGEAMVKVLREMGGVLTVEDLKVRTFGKGRPLIFSGFRAQALKAQGCGCCFCGCFVWRQLHTYSSTS